jgi:hypothetical protein
MADLLNLLIVAMLATVTWLLVEVFARLSTPAEGRK